MKKFDLNIEKVLDNWETYHAVREVIANALDEQLLTKTKDIEIVQDKQRLWHIRDFGRGLRYEHLTQKENEEKLHHPNLIGKFGVGLKDALMALRSRAIYSRSSLGVESCMRVPIPALHRAAQKSAAPVSFVRCASRSMKAKIAKAS